MKKIDVSYREWDLLDRLTDKASVAFTYMQSVLVDAPLEMR